MRNGGAQPRIERPRVQDVVIVPETIRRLVRAVRAWALTKGRAVDPEALAAVMLVTDCPTDAPVTFTTEQIVELVWLGVHGWCQELGAALSEPPWEALWTFLDYLAAHDLLAEGSDPLGALQLELRTHAGLDRFGRRPRRTR